MLSVRSILIKINITSPSLVRFWCTSNNINIHDVIYNIHIIPSIYYGGHSDSTTIHSCDDNTRFAYLLIPNFALIHNINACHVLVLTTTFRAQYICSEVELPWLSRPTGRSREGFVYLDQTRRVYSCLCPGSVILPRYDMFVVLLCCMLHLCFLIYLSLPSANGDVLCILIYMCYCFMLFCCTYSISNITCICSRLASVSLTGL
jgi:hypothetical protein